VKNLRDPIVAIGMICAAAALFLPLGMAGMWASMGYALALWLAMMAIFGLFWLRPQPVAVEAGFYALAAVLGGGALLLLLSAGAAGPQAPGLWLGLVALAFLAWRVMERAASLSATWRGPVLAASAPLAFGVWFLFLWQVLVTGFQVPSVLLPAPSAIWASIRTAHETLALDFVQTFVRAVIPGFVIGCGAGFLTGVLIDRAPFLQRGLLPVGNLVSALPIVAIAPIMVMWFGFDWQSKAAVVVVMTFFPMLVNTIAGLNALGRIERDLMATYAAGYGQVLLMAKLPAALPFVFNALKINATLALIGAIVAEFFGTPILGMGFRISTEVGRMNISMVWATIAVAAVAGSTSYALLSLAERKLTFWHPSFRKA
jgi:NitT/TauT family transport system permease protein